MKFFYKTKGVISVFLILIMLPLFTAAVLMVDGTRYQSARTMVQEAGDLAAYSTIADYNMDLKDDFGLFAVRDENVEAAFKKYFGDSLGYKTRGGEDYSAKVQSFMTNAFSGGQYRNAKFFNMYNFSVDEASVKGLYPLSEPAVLQNQIVEYMKYRSIETIFERFGIFDKFDKAGEIETQNQKTAQAITELSAADSAYSGQLSSSLSNLKASVENYRSELDKFTTTLDDFEEACAQEAASVAVKADDIETRKQARITAQNDISTAETNLNTAYTNLLTEIDTVQYHAGTAKDKYEEMRSKYSDQPDILEDIDKELTIINKVLSTSDKDREYSPAAFKNFLVKPQELFSSVNAKVAKWNDNMSDTYFNYNQECNRIREDMKDASAQDIQEQIDGVMYHIYNAEGTTEWLKTAEDNTEAERSDVLSNAGPFVSGYNVKSYYTAHKKEIIPPPFENYYLVYATEHNNNTTGQKVDNEEYAKKIKDDANNMQKDSKPEEEESSAKVTIDSGVFNTLPSKKKGVSDDIEEMEPKEIDDKHVDEAIDSATSLSKDLSGFLESTRNDVFTFCYMLDTFKTRLTDKNISSSDKPLAVPDKYLVSWRYSSDKGEVDTRDRAKKPMESYFGTNEVEYIFGGKASEFANSTIVYSWIYGTRLANNLIAVYKDPDAKAECEMLAIASSAAIGGLVPASVFKWLYITAWAIGETCLDMHYLTEKGYKIPLVKTKLFIEHVWDAASALTSADSLLLSYKGNTALNVSYEDYLVILLCFVKRETRLLRIADLIQLDMTKRHESFSIDKAYTYIKADTTVSMKYMFQPISQFTDAYNGTGLKLKNTIYQGY